MTVIHGPGEGEVHVAGNATIAIKATGADTAGSFFLSETTIAPGFPGPPPHRHERPLTLSVDGETRELPPGAFACAAPGTVHTFANRTGAAVRFLNFNTPSGWEHYMRELAAAGRERPLTP